MTGYIIQRIEELDIVRRIFDTIEHKEYLPQEHDMIHYTRLDFLSSPPKI